MTTSPLPFGIQLFTDADYVIDGVWTFTKSPLPFGIQLFTDVDALIVPQYLGTKVSIAFRHSTLH